MAKKKKVNKVTDEQLTLIKELNTKNNNLTQQLGMLSRQYHAMLHESFVVDAEMEQLKEALEKQYGAVNINLLDGAYTHIETDVKDKKD